MKNAQKFSCEADKKCLENHMAYYDRLSLESMFEHRQRLSAELAKPEISEDYRKYLMRILIELNRYEREHYELEEMGHQFHIMLETFHERTRETEEDKQRRIKVAEEYQPILEKNRNKNNLSNWFVIGAVVTVGAAITAGWCYVVNKCCNSASLKYPVDLDE